jgi:hypothetical protein
MSRSIPMESIPRKKTVKGYGETMKTREQQSRTAVDKYNGSELHFAKRLLDASKQRRLYKRNVLLQVEQELEDRPVTPMYEISSTNKESLWSRIQFVPTLGKQNEFERCIGEGIEFE